MSVLTGSCPTQTKGAKIKNRLQSHLCISSNSQFWRCTAGLWKSAVHNMYERTQFGALLSRSLNQARTPRRKDLRFLETDVLKATVRVLHATPQLSFASSLPLAPCVMRCCWSSQSAESVDLKGPAPLPLRPSCFPFFWGIWTEGEDTVDVGSCWFCRTKSSLKTESIWRQTSCNLKVKILNTRGNREKCLFSLLLSSRASASVLANY